MLIEKRLDGKIVEYENENNINALVSNKSKIHLCWDCVNGYPSKCPKVSDLKKGTVDSYDFVKEGYQVIENDEVTEFIVTVCSCFEKYVEKTGEEKAQAVKQMKRTLKLLHADYYDTETPEEVLRNYAASSADGKKVKLLKL